VPPEEVTHDELQTLLRLAHFLDTTRIGFAYFDADGVIRDCNQMVASLVGSTIAELVGQPFDNATWRTVHPDGTPFTFGDFLGNDPVDAARADVIIGLDFERAPRRWFSLDLFPVGRDGVIATIADVTSSVIHTRLLEIVSEVNHFAMVATNENEIIQHLCDALVAPERHALAWVGTALDFPAGAVELTAAAGATGYLKDVELSSLPDVVTGRGPVGISLRTRETRVIDDLDKDPSFAPWRERAASFGFESIVTIPFSPNGERAVLAVYDRNVFAFSDQVLSKLETVVKEVEFSIDHIRSIAQLAASLDGTLSVLSRVTETRDPYTAGHQSRVAALSEAIARHLGVEESLVALIRQAGEVHDIGKTAIPTEILTRPGKLSALDYELVQTHCEVGAGILAGAPLPWPLAEVARSHHERLDGSGYPQGLVGDQIVLPARIVAVADVVEAMMHHRPYRPGLGLDAALEEIRSGAGRLYDPEVAAACLAVFDGGFQFEAI
jgi:HD-GYP domain-containing protein (c-di-GMP phosphodiesterase class II)